MAVYLSNDSGQLSEVQWLFSTRPDEDRISLDLQLGAMITVNDRLDVCYDEPQIDII